jgi:hypothetical protein
MKFFALLLIFVLTSCAPDANGAKVSFASKFAGLFPQDPQDAVLPIWKGSLEFVEPVALGAIKSFDVQFQGVFAYEITEARNGLRVRELRGIGLVRNNLQIYLSETLEHVSVGVFDMSVPYPNRSPDNSVGAKLEAVIAAVLDAKFERDRL